MIISVSGLFLPYSFHNQVFVHYAWSLSEFLNSEIKFCLIVKYLTDTSEYSHFMLNAIWRLFSAWVLEIKYQALGTSAGLALYAAAKFWLNLAVTYFQ